jgi:hypothetical protein
MALLFVLPILAQHPLEKFSYVTLSERFDFLYEDDQYQLNSLTKFLLEKHGFNPYFDSQVPDFRRCDGLRLVVEGSPGFIYTKITLIFKDCNNFEIFRSEEGRSKHKDYRKTYHEALRNAFESVAALNIQQTEPTAAQVDQQNPSVQTEIRKASVSEEKPVVDIGEKPLYPNSKFTSFLQQGNSYLLRKTSEGFALYEETATAADGLLWKGIISIVNDNATYTDEEGNSLPVSFDNLGNFIIAMAEGEMMFERVR